ncbi:CBS domain-containing protein [bacterium CPR1]|nr:CBS domain-containing protein [bacterium CPR1]
MKDLRIRDVMERDVFCVTPDMDVKQFVAECVRRKITGAPVIDSDHLLVGLLSLSDVAASLAFPRPEDDGRVQTIMTRQVHTIEAGMRVKVAVDLFRQHRIHRLVVTYHNQVLGLVSPIDLLGLTSEHESVKF